MSDQFLHFAEPHPFYPTVVTKPRATDMQPFSKTNASRIFAARRWCFRYACIGIVGTSLGWAQPAHSQAPPAATKAIAAATPDAPPSRERNASSEVDIADIGASNPKSVYVAVSRAEVYSGPSAEYYPTGHVQRGMALEAYHRTADGWLGIRPPEGSFSWVPATDAYLLPGGRVIEITSQHAVSWIGSSLGSAKLYRWQVELRPGEQLTVLGEMTNKNEDEQEVLWYKIGPPAGEFRWIQEKAISLTAVAPAERQISIPVNGDVRTASHQKQASGQAVQAADYSEDIFAEGTVVYDDSGAEIIDGEVIYDGEYHDGQYYEDGSYLEGGEVVYESSNVTTKGGGWDGWHAMDLTDEGFRIPFLERRYQQAQARRLVDPLNHDPFSLSMPSKVSEAHSVRQEVREDVGIAPDRRFTPWRDPRELRSKRMQGNIGSSLSATTSTNLSTSDVAARDVKTEDSQTASDDLLGRLVSAVKSSLPDDIQGNPSVAMHEDSNSKEQSWYGVDATKSTNAPTVNALELGQLQLVLSEMVAQPMNAWNLQPLMERAKHFIEHGASAIERGQARLMLERIEDFDRLAKKSGFGGTSPVLTASATLPHSANSPAPAPTITNAGYESALNPNSAAQSGYDATGWLVPVRTAAAGQPTHAITNDAGRVIAYVSGLPGMNLDLYVNQAVGISGLRGFLPQLQSQHIQAQRVVRLR